MLTSIGSKSETVKPKWVQRASPLALCIGETGKLGAGILLYRIHWWTGHTRFKRNGHLWIVKSVDQWMVDTGLTYEQVKDAKKRLLKLDMIVSARFQTSRNSTLTLAAVRLSEKGAKVLNGPNALEIAKVPNGPDAMGAKVPNGSVAPGAKVPNGPSTMEEEENLENEENQEEAAPSGTAHPGDVDFSEGSQEGGKTGKHSVPGSSGSPAALPALLSTAHAIAKITRATPLPDVFKAIGTFYASLTTEHARHDVHHGWEQAKLGRGGIPTGWGKKEWGQAATLREAWGQYSGAFGGAFIAFVCVLRWEAFRDFCKAHTAKSEHWNLSAAPSLGCLVLFRDHAAEFTQEHIASIKGDMAEAEAKAVKEAKAKADAEAKAKTAEEAEAKLIKYRGFKYNAAGARVGLYADKDQEKYLEERDRVMGVLEINHIDDPWPADHPYHVWKKMCSLDRDHTLDAMINAITVQHEAKKPLDGLAAKYALPLLRVEWIAGLFSGKEWAQRVREADQLKVAA